jgi:hypothetical protein
VLDASVNLASEQASVTYVPASVGWSELKAAVEQAGYLEGAQGAYRQHGYADRTGSVGGLLL